MQKQEYFKMHQMENYHWWYRAKRLFLNTYLKLIKEPVEGCRILDIGCGTGRNFEILSQYGVVIGLDMFPIALRFTTEHPYKALVRSAADSLPFQDNTFNIVTIIDVMYHCSIQDDKKVISEICRVLRPGGYLLLMDCASPFLFGPHDLKNFARERYTKKGLANKIIKFNFSIVSSTHLFFTVFPFFAVSRLIEKYVTKNESNVQLPFYLNNLLYYCCILENAMLSFVSFPFGSSLLFLCQKKSNEHTCA